MTTYKMKFDFTTSDQRDILKKLQENNYNLLGYKGAEGPGQVDVGVPTWFSVPFGNIFGLTEIDYTPTYKIYVSNQADIAANTTIQMQMLSSEVTLGSSHIFKEDGRFVPGGVDKVPADSIGLFNDRPANTLELTVGLAGLVNLPDGRQFKPFCAFTLPPQNSIVMKPLENILLVAARLNVQSGNVQAFVSSPGCTFSFSSETIQYQLEMEQNTYAITNVPETAGVTSVSSGATIADIINA